MTGMSSRRGFLRGGFRNEEQVRPPGAAADDVFGRLCDGCGKCIDACPEEIIRLDRNGWAMLDFATGPCTFCGRCIDACPTGALDVGEAENRKRVARVSESCLSLRGVSCRTCEDFCDERAIRFRLQTGGRAVPEISSGTCTGCGGCIGGCPVGAAELVKVAEPEALKPGAAR